MFRLVPIRAFKQIGRLPFRSLSLSTKVFKENIEDTGPIKYSTSPASKYSAKSTRTGVHSEPRLWYEPYVIITSITVFMIYFTILREENDIDEELGRSLYSRIEGLEEFQLKQSLAYNESHGEDTKEIKQRLAELEAEKTKTNQDD
ncbi:uncharacterized protein LOC130441533 [Diorhabda sublineata]|uniref:uncharacterized protein LOC130441533 n=1 Tax=Diorhabda sublineata TaxID=1163346 RepID=UPI0024E1876D|nr:uncharacterized protein LOC130441533 [Diorhabda sublineata]